MDIEKQNSSTFTSDESLNDDSLINGLKTKIEGILSNSTVDISHQTHLNVLDSTESNGERIEIRDSEGKIIAYTGYILEAYEKETIGRLFVEGECFEIMVENSLRGNSIGESLLDLILKKSREAGAVGFTIVGVTKSSKSFYDKTLKKSQESLLLDDYKIIFRENSGDYIYAVTFKKSLNKISEFINKNYF